ncbi:unnamed protein product, partial [Rotaria sp. Silwood1]
MIASTLTRNSVNPVWLNANTTLTNYHQSYSTIKKEVATQTSNLLSNMGNMIHATVHENEYQVTIQTVFRKPENLSQSPFFINETNEYYPINSERNSPYSNTIYFD